MLFVRDSAEIGVVMLIGFFDRAGGDAAPAWIALGGQQDGQLGLDPRKDLLGMFAASGVVLFSRPAPSLQFLQQFILGRFAVLEAMIPAMLRPLRSQITT